MSSERNIRQIFFIPAVLGVFSLIGLITALVGDGIYDFLSWVALCIPLFVLGVCLRRVERKQI